MIHSAGRPGLLLALFMPPLFLSALLMFWSQPLVGKMILPLLGGTPMVWTTCMVFFQALLLAGYGYAHFSLKLGMRRQAMLHITLLAVSLIALPIGFDAQRWEPPTSDNPMGWLFLLLAVSAAAPFFMLSATAPMLQAWFARTDHPAAADPYFLYVTSNLGSLIGLLGFPTMAEVYLTIPGQTSAWSGLYVLLVVGIALASLAAFKAREPAAAKPSAKLAPATGAIIAGAPTATLRFRWVLLAFAPSSLFIGLTTYVTTDIAAVPLLWILPLAGYLLTFIVAFARRPAIPHDQAIALQPYFVLPVIILFFWGGGGGSATFFTIALHFFAFFVTALVCHGELARTRPDPEHLTEFYFLLSLGGVLGGIFNAIVAPVAFTALVEYPLVLLLALFLRPGAGTESVPRPALKDLILPGAVFAVLLFALWRFPDTFTDADSVMQTTVGIILALIAASAAKRPWQFGLLASAILLAQLLFPIGGRSTELKAERNFFGIIRVTQEEKPPMMTMYHGTTNHGSQSLEPDRRLIPQTYYFPGSPITQVFQFPVVRRPGAQLSVLGLGTGALACLARSGQTFTYYEIDPAVERMARDTTLFTFMRDCPPDKKVVLGDGRLTLQKMPNASQDLLVMDAFTSDAVPVHLLTREALAMYLTKLKEDGVLVYHISNRYLDLKPVLAGLGADAGLEAFLQEYDAPASNPSAFGSTWVVMARPGPTAEFIRADRRWQPLKPTGEDRLWTDHYSNIFTALKW
jgi:multisubunit Na+/H+ antiporter MnhG subunit